jgi:hypothetical protein
MRREINSTIGTETYLEENITARFSEINTSLGEINDNISTVQGQ